MSDKDQIQFERISAYLTENMSAEDLQEFEKALATDENLRDELAIQKELQLAIELGGLNETLEQIHEEHFLEETTAQNNWFAIAAGIAALLAFGIWFVNQDTPSEALFAEYATIEPGLPVPMSSTSQYDFYDAMVDYKSEKYELAISKWAQILVEKPNNDTLNFYIGSAYFNQEKYTDALPYLTEVESKTISNLKNKAQWYMVLTYLKLENTAAVRAVSPSHNSPYSDKIKAIQNSL